MSKYTTGRRDERVPVLHRQELVSELTKGRRRGETSSPVGKGEW